MNRNLVQPPKERVNISYRSKADGAGAETELPLKMLVVGDFTGTAHETPIEERTTLSVNRERFDEVMASQNLAVDIQVDNHLGGQGAANDGASEADKLDVHLEFKKLSDFSPENLCQQSAPLAQLIELRQALVALKGPLGNFPQFRRKLEQILRDPAMRERLLRELSASDAAAAENETDIPPKQLDASNNDATQTEAL